MQRRGFLKLGVGAAIVIGVAGAGVALIKPGLVDNKLSPGARELMGAVARAVLGELLPASAVDAQLARLDATVAALPAASRKELSDALGLLSTAAGRYALVGLSKPWGEASAADIEQALNAMRLSTSDTRQQVYHALRDLNALAFFTAPDNWKTAGYAGQREIP
jgi:hypothetical protein